MSNLHRPGEEKARFCYVTTGCVDIFHCMFENVQNEHKLNLQLIVLRHHHR